MDAEPEDGLSLEELAKCNAPHSDHFQMIRDFAASHQLDVVEESHLRHDVVLEATSDTLSSAFGVNLCDYEHEHGSYRAHDEPIQLPEELHEVVEAVLGLDNIPCSAKHYGLQVAESQPACGSTQSGTGSLSLMNPLDVASYYKFPESETGAGQRIAIFQFGGGYYSEDLKAFLKPLGITPPQPNDIGIGGGSNKPMQFDLLQEITKTVNVDGEAAIKKYGPKLFTEWSHTLEATMDLQLVAALAPAAEIDVYFIRGGTQEFRQAMFAAQGDRRSAGGQDVQPATVLSDSWGNTESGYTGYALTVLNQAMQSLKRSRITMCCASGDYGSRGINPGKPTTTAHVVFPASSPFALACGGTTLKPAGATFDGEEAWNEQINGVHLASTGGISGQWPLPEWQSKAGVPTPQSLSGNGTWLSAKAQETCNYVGRGVPDVAASAYLANGYRIILGGVATAGGGASASAPLWASLIARINQSRTTSLGCVTPKLYECGIENAFNSISENNNKVTDDPNIPYYSAKAGWDACTGLGSPIGTELLEKLS